jgi:hypothetical protein
MEGVTVTDDVAVEEEVVDVELNDCVTIGGEKKPPPPEDCPPANSVLGE